ncbi:MAG: hypothetical protein M3R36_16900 [Bacteroidota bacterium]|nr:hypothetical protein [Bacteroidota bacterium]
MGNVKRETGDGRRETSNVDSEELQSVMKITFDRIIIFGKDMEGLKNFYINNFSRRRWCCLPAAGRVTKRFA